jgi:hypothetical protein
MRVRNGILGSLLSTNRGNWWQATTLLLFTLIGGLAPLWLGAGLAALFSKHVSLLAFSSNGEFAIYCASIVAPTFYLILHERTPQRLSGQTLLTLLALVLLLAAVSAYMAIVPVPSRVLSLAELDKELYSRVCFYLLLSSIGFALLVTALDNARTTPDVQALSEDQQKTLRAEYDQLEDRP